MGETLQGAQTGEPLHGSLEEAVPEASSAAAQTGEPLHRSLEQAVPEASSAAAGKVQIAQTGKPFHGAVAEPVPELSDAALGRQVSVLHVRLGETETQAASSAAAPSKSKTPNVASAKARPKAKANRKAKDNTPQGDTQQVRSATKETTQQATAELASGKVEDRQAEALATLQNDQTGEPPRGSNEEAVPEASAAAARKVRIEPNVASAKAMPKAKAKRKAKDNTPQGDTQQVRSAKKETTQQANAELASGKVED